MGATNYHSRVQPVRALPTYAEEIERLDNEDLIDMYANYIQDLDPSDPDDAEDLRRLQNADGTWNRAALIDEALTSESGAASFWELQTEQVNMRLAEFTPTMGVDFTGIPVDPTSPRASDELRSYPAIVIGEFVTSFDYAGVNVGVWLDVILRSGYYEGRNLDYRIRVDDDYSHDPYFFDEYQPPYSIARAVIEDISEAQEMYFSLDRVDELQTRIDYEVEKLITNFNELISPLTNKEGV